MKYFKLLIFFLLYGCQNKFNLYKTNAKNGQWIEVDSVGRVFVNNYKNGLRKGKCYIVSSLGGFTQVTYKNELKNGIVYVHNRENKIIEVLKFKNDTLKTIIKKWEPPLF